MANTSMNGNVWIHWEFVVDPFTGLYAILVIFYIYVIYVLKTTRNSKFKTHYFTVFIITGISDILFAIDIEYDRMSYRVGLGFKGQADGYMVKLSTGAIHVFLFVHFGGVTLLSFFQFSALWMPMSHQKFWTTKFTCSVMLLFFVVAIGCDFRLFILDWTYYITYDFPPLRQRYDTRVEKISEVRIFNVITALFQIVLLIFFTTSTLYGIRHRVRFVQASNLPDKSLIFVTVVNIILAILALYYHIYKLFGFTFWKSLYDEVDHFYLVMATVNAWLLLLLNRTLRHEIRNRWITRHKKVISVGATMRSNS